jgi:predicted regulator of Ras-like GTPase activity (Roadblock/LC7/MglB family)
MQEILQNITGGDGVIGCAVFNENGSVVEQAFPPLIDASSLKAAAGLVMECVRGLQIAQTLDILDLRYAEGRIIVKAFPGALLYLLCAKNINIQLLTITLNLAVKKLAPLLPTAAGSEGTGPGSG